jgi:putative hydrolase of the HAD superfamily
MGTGMIDTKGTRNIILDLGGVILELDVNRTIRAFHALGFPPLQSADIILSRYPFFLEFETGEISPENFIDRVLEISGNHASTDRVLDAWNAMILGFRKETIELLLRLRREFRLFLLSNTNAIHEITYNRQLREDHGIPNLRDLFEKVYYSHELKLRKPDAQIFRFLLQDAELEAGECLYIDDTLDHIESARTLGIRSYHLAPPGRLTEVL